MIKYNFKSFLERSLDSEPNNNIITTLGEDFELKETGPWLAGGALRRLLSNKPLDSDFDIFFSNEEQKEEIEKKICSNGGKALVGNDFNTSYEYSKGEEKLKVQLIHIAYYSNVEELLNSFDYTICQFAYDGTSLYCGDYSLWDLARKRLAVNKVTYGVASVRRMLKYAKQGFYACPGCINNLLQDIADSPDTIKKEIVYVD